MEWNNEKCLQLIDEYEKHPILWEAKHPQHFSRNMKSDAWQSIANNLKIQEHEAKQKINSLLGSFRREKSKGVKTVGTGKGRAEIYVSKWFAFERMHFLLDKDEPRNRTDTENVSDNFETQNDPDIVEHQPLSANSEDSNLEAIPESAPSQSAIQDNIHAPRENFQTPVSQKPKRIKTGNKNEDPRLADAYSILKQTVATREEPEDEFTAYGKYIANKLRGYTKRTQAEVQHSFNNILYEADIGRYDFQPQPHTGYQYYPTNSPLPNLTIQPNIFPPRSPYSAPTPSPSGSSSTDPTPITTHIQYTPQVFSRNATPTPNQRSIPASNENLNPTPNPSSLDMPDITFGFGN